MTLGDSSHDRNQEIDRIKEAACQTSTDIAHLLTGRVDSPFQHFWIITSVDFCIDTGGHFSHWDLQHAGFLKDCFNGMELQDFYCVVLKGSSDAKFTFTCCLNINVCWQCLYTSTL